MASRHIILAEDDARLRSVLARYLARRGHTVHEAATAAEVWDALAHDTVDLLVVDINLPDETGWEILRRLREGKTCPVVVVMTAGVPSRSRLTALRPDAVLTKPFPIDALSRLVESEAPAAAD
ncbi:MAG: response regulator [Sphaerobacter sp.]|nr:response regulator [Sphaerobacter sp.]